MDPLAVRRLESQTVDVDVLSARRLESILASLSFFERLRPDEIGRVARRFVVSELAPKETRAFTASMDAVSSDSPAPQLPGARLIVVVGGRVELEVTAGTLTLESTLEPGDRYGETALLTGHARALTLTSEEGASVATLDRAGLDALLAEFPAIALVLSTELASELNAKNDVVRQLLEVHAEGLSPAQLEAAVDERRQALARRGARVTRLTARVLFRRLVIERGAEPPFWMLTGFIASLGLARLVVALILKYGLEKRLFALVPGNDPNPMHVHHFNYGLVLIGASGLAALVPFGRRALRVLGFTFGFGCGLVFDEFALFWNLNPEYAQSLSLIAAAIMAAVFIQLTYFRRYWVALARRSWFALRGAR